jgi:hypothetical protein
VIKTLEAQVGQFALDCMCPVSRGIVVQEQDNTPLYFQFKPTCRIGYQELSVLDFHCPARDQRLRRRPHQLRSAVNCAGNVYSY